MLTTYRIFKTKHAASWFDGEGSFRYGGRWNSPGHRILYTSASLSLAALEMLVHLNYEGLLQSYSFATVRFNESDVVSIKKLPANWNRSPAPVAIQRLGNEWARSRSSLVLRVPSAVLKGEFNYLINVAHPAFKKIKRGTPRRFDFDERLLKH